MMNKINPPFSLIILMIMAPQILETLYSPALTVISQHYLVSHEKSSQTLSVYFIAFAIWVAFWGCFCDKFGRRIAMLSGLLVYLVGAFLALFSMTFSTLLLARIIVAFGAAVGSVVTQTMMRDSYEGAALGKAFATTGMALSLSPMIGMFSGGILVHLGGSSAVFLGQLLLALALLLWCFNSLPETSVSQQKTRQPLLGILFILLRDRHIWLSALLVALFNIMLFSYYSLAPFMFERLGFTSQQFGYTGIILAFGSLIGAILNRYLIFRGIIPLTQVFFGVLLAMLADFTLLWLQNSMMLLLPCSIVMVAFSLVIPNVLSQALIDYKQQSGIAGALFGLLYYLFIGVGLVLVAAIQNLTFTLMLCSALALICSIFYKKGHS